MYRESKVDFLLSFDIYCSSMYSEIRPYPNVMMISHVTCLDRECMCVQERERERTFYWAFFFL